MKILHYDVHVWMNYPSIEKTYVDWSEISEFDFERSKHRSMNRNKQQIQLLTSTSFRVELLFVFVNGVDGGVSTTDSSSIGQSAQFRRFCRIIVDDSSWLLSSVDTGVSGMTKTSSEICRGDRSGGGGVCSVWPWDCRSLFLREPVCSFEFLFLE